jgi:hypothetical protein
MSSAVALDPKAVIVHPAGHLARNWEVKLPAGISYATIFRPSTWAAIEKLMRTRGGGKRPAKNDLVRIIGSQFDVICIVVAVEDGYRLEFYSGKRPPALAQVLADLDALPQAATSADIKKQAATLSKRWRDSGVGREHLNAARRTYAKASHPDTNETDGKRLAAANAILDHAMATLQEPA